MSLLEQVTKGKQPKPRRIMLYGVQGIGKSTFASKAPKPVFIQTEDGLGDVECSKFPLSKSFEDVMIALRNLYTEPHSYKTLVIDSLDWLETLIWKHTCMTKEWKHKIDNIEDFGYAKGYTFALEHWWKLIDGLSALRDDKNMSVVLIAHSRIEKFENPETDSYDRFTPRLHKHASAVIQEWCDEVLFATYKIYTKATDAGFERTRHQAVGTGERIMRTTERPSHAAKNRLNLPDELPLRWDSFAEHINTKGVKK